MANHIYLGLPSCFLFQGVDWGASDSFCKLVIKLWYRLYIPALIRTQKATFSSPLPRRGSATIRSCRVFSAVLWFWVKEHSVYCACTVPWDPSSERTKITGIWDSLRQLRKSEPWTAALSLTFLIMVWLDRCALCPHRGVCPCWVWLYSRCSDKDRNASLCCDKTVWHALIVSFILLSEDPLSHPSTDCTQTSPLCPTWIELKASHECLCSLWSLSSQVIQSPCQPLLVSYLSSVVATLSHMALFSSGG